VEARALVVESSQLARAHRVTFAEQRTKEREELEAALRAVQREEYACLEDAARGARALLARLCPRFHKLSDLVRVEYVREKRPHAGRPRKDEPPPPTHEVYRALFSFAKDDAAFETEVKDASRFILLTTHPETGPRGRTSAQIFTAYNGQWKVERTMKALKQALKLAPIHLHDEQRINGLARVYMLALMVHALIERDARRRLARLQAKIAGNLAHTSRPTTEVVFRLFAGVSTVRAPGTAGVRVVNLTTAQAAGYKRLGSDVLEGPGVVVAPPRPVEPGDRGYYHPREHRRRARPRSDV
jgi:transposase